MKASPFLSGTLALITTVVMFPAGARAALEAYLLIPAVPGESTDTAHNNWIDIESFSLGAHQRPAPAYGLFAEELVLAKRLDKASPRLFLACAQGTEFATVTIELTEDFGPFTDVVFYKIILTDARVASVTLVEDTAGTDRPVEEVAFSYEKIEIRYFVVNPTTGVAMPETPVTWNYVNQTP